MALRAIVAWRRRTAHRGAFSPSLLRQSHEFGMARGDRRQIEAVGLDDAPGLLVPAGPIPGARGDVRWRMIRHRDPPRRHGGRSTGQPGGMRPGLIRAITIDGAHGNFRQKMTPRFGRGSYPGA